MFSEWALVDVFADEGYSGSMRKAADRAEDERITIRDRTQGGMQEKAEGGGHFRWQGTIWLAHCEQGCQGESYLAAPQWCFSLSARGLTCGEVSAHLAVVYGAEVSRTTIFTIRDKGLDGMHEWQNRPLDSA